MLVVWVRESNTIFLFSNDFEKLNSFIAVSIYGMVDKARRYLFESRHYPLVLCDLSASWTRRITSRAGLGPHMLTSRPKYMQTEIQHEKINWACKAGALDMRE